MLCLAACVLAFSALPATAEDMRAASRKAQAEYDAAQAESQKSTRRILEDRATLEREVGGLEGRVKAMAAELESVNTALLALDARKKELSETQADSEMGLRELTGTLRVAARDLDASLRQSPLTAITPQRVDRLQPLMDKDHFPDLRDATILT